MSVNKKKLLLPVVILAVFIFVGKLITGNPPEPNRKKVSNKPQLTVEVQKLEEADYPVKLQSYGTVRPRVQSQLVAQVSGQIVKINPQFRNGGFFEPGDELVQIDDRDYVSEQSIAEAALINAKQVLAEEQARSKQALEDWRRLGDDSPAPDLVLRKPQLKAAEAQVMSAQSSLDKANLLLERTRIVAPFAGRILEKKVDVGQVVSTNTQLAEVYATDYVEIRLPLKNRDLDFIRLPESYRFDSGKKAEPVKVTIRSELVGRQSWQGAIVRTEGAIDGNSRQLHVVAQIDDPYGLTASGKQPLKIGEYVTAEIEGIQVQGAIIIPNSTIYQGSYVYLVNEGTLIRREIELAWQNDEQAIVKSGLEAGEQLVLTPLGQVASGVPVKVSNKDPALKRQAQREVAQKKGKAAEVAQ